MAEYWIYYAITASVLVGLYAFAQKMKAENPNQSDNGFIFYSYLLMGFCGLFGGFIFGKGLEVFNLQTLSFAFGITAFYIVIIKTRLLSLRHLSSSTYYINYRILSSMWLIVVGILLFSESISLKQYTGIGLGFLVFYLLLEKKKHGETIQGFKKGFLYLFIGSLGVTGVQALAKNFALSSHDIFLLIFYQGFFGMLFVMLFKGKETLKNIYTIHDTKQFFFLLISGLLFGVATIINNYAFIGGNLAIVYKIISYSLFIPIILSIIIYKEKVTPKKLLAFLLTFISMFLFF